MTTTPDTPAAPHAADSLTVASISPTPAACQGEGAAAARRTLIIEAGRVEAEYWRDLWLGRELLGFMVWRDIVVRYKQTVIGIAWSVLRPFLTMVAGTFVFRYILQLEGMNGVPYALMIYTALLPWQFFSDALTAISSGLLNNSGMITKIYFPRLMIPLSKLMVSLVDFLISCTVLALLMVWYRYLPGWQIIALPLPLLLVCLTGLGVGLWFAALNVKYRDFIYVVPFIVMFGGYICPVFFQTEKVYSRHIPEWAKNLYALNPMVTVIDGFRWSLLHGDVPMRLWPAIGSIVIVLVILYTGHRYFRKTETTFADVI